MSYCCCVHVLVDSKQTCRAQLALLEVLLLCPRPVTGPSCCPRSRLQHARATRQPHDRTAHCHRHHAVPPHRRVPTSPTPLQRPRRLCHLDAHALNAAVASAPSSPLFALTTSCRSPHHHPRRTSSRNAPATLRAYKWARPRRALPPAELAEPPSSAVHLLLHENLPLLCFYTEHGSLVDLHLLATTARLAWR